MTTYITVAIPYVNAEPHLGYAFELIEADLAARARRALGEPVRFLGGTDEHSLKNVLAAESSGEPTQRFVDRHADRFVQLAESLGSASTTSSEPAAMRAIAQRSSGCGELVLGAATCTDVGTPAATASGASSSTIPPTSSPVDALNTALRSKRSPRSTGSSGSPATPTSSSS